MVLKNKISLYWKCQILGWGLVSLYWLYITLNRDDYSVFLAVCNYLLDVVICISLTHLYRKVAIRHNWKSLSLGKLLLKAIPSVLALAFGFMLFVNLKWYFFWEIITGQNFGFYNTLFIWDPVFITGLRLMSIWVLAYHLYNYHNREVNTLKLNAELSTMAKQAQLDNLLAQLNPHFLFNSLNSIKSLIVENPSSARRAIDLLSDLLRFSLNRKDSELITVEEELLLVNDYLELEKIRYENRLSFAFDISESSKVQKVPKFSIQLLVENAIKHGIDKFRKGGEIDITVLDDDNFITINVENPGTITENVSKGIGLENLKKRLLIQFNGDANFSIQQKSINLVATTIQIPKF